MLQNLFGREIRRGNKYDAIIMDPPSYGRGKNGEVWQFENNISDLVELCSEVLSDNPLFFLINSYTTGISSKVLENILSIKLKRYKGKLSSGEKVLYEDNHIIVVEKPVNIPSQGDKTGDMDMLTIIKKYLKEKYNKPGEVYLGLVHRLDRPTGGVMVFAKTSKAAGRLSEQVRDKKMHKKYLCIVDGKLDKEKDKLTDFLLKNEKTNTSKVVKEGTKNSKEAVLDYEVIKYNEEINLSVVKVNLHTGRHHQIRLQFSSRGHSLYGDQKYGTRGRGKQLALWAYYLSFEHPTKKELMEFEDYPEITGSWKILE